MIPEGFELNAKKVVAGVFSTAVIDNEGELKFWFHRPNSLPENIRTFEGYSEGKMSLSSKFFCAINDLKQLSCYLVTPTQAKLKKLRIPPHIFSQAVVDVSAGE
jgi:hypothetical protein